MIFFLHWQHAWFAANDWTPSISPSMVNGKYSTESFSVTVPVGGCSLGVVPAHRVAMVTSLGRLNCLGSHQPLWHQLPSSSTGDELISIIWLIIIDCRDFAYIVGSGYFLWLKVDVINTVKGNIAVHGDWQTERQTDSLLDYDFITEIYTAHS